MRSRFLAFFLCGMPAVISAQGTRDQLIPRDLVEALIATDGMGGRPEISVGNLPAVLAPKVKLPAGAKVLGGMAMREAVIGVVTVDGALNSIAPSFHKDLLAQGWEIPVDDPMDMFRSEFIDPPSSERRVVTDGRPEMYCGKAGTLTVRYVPDGFQRTTIILASRAQNQCAIMRDQMFRSSLGGIEAPKRPVLVNLAAARNSPGACQNYNLGRGDRKTDLGSQLPPSEILAHYAKQLTDSGWTQSGTTVAAIFQKRDTSGVLNEYQIVVHAPTAGAGCRSVRTDLNGSSR